jgi:hypothetical protein
MALSREFKITERQVIQLRADAFNIANSFVANLASTATPTSAAVPAFAGVTNNLFGIINRRMRSWRSPAGEPKS